MAEEPFESCWELMILDAEAPSERLDSLAAADIDGDGHVELVIGGMPVNTKFSNLFWYRPATRERGIIAPGGYHVGIALEDVDGDGVLEVVAGGLPPVNAIFWFKPGANLHDPWTKNVLHPRAAGAHDLLFADIDGDGERELLASDMTPGNPGLFIFKRNGEPHRPWQKYEVVTGVSAEGLDVGDLDGDGRLEIVFGPDWYAPRAEGPLAGPWLRGPVAHGFRDMCRVALVDITGNGRPDAIICESEYEDGRLRWFENRFGQDPGNPWREHEIAPGELFSFAHTLRAWKDPATNHARFLFAEMAEGGWNPPRNYNALVAIYTTPDGGRHWQRETVSRGTGTHEALFCDVDGDGEAEVVGKEWIHHKVQIWKRRTEPSPQLRFRHRILDRDKPGVSTDILAVDVDGDGLNDVVTGSWWYRNPGWERRRIPDISQVISAYDLDGDGRQELIATRGPGNFSSELCWLKPIDPLAGKWQVHPIGLGTGDWPHGALVAPLLPGGRPALVIAYHSAYKDPHYPELFEVPQDPTLCPWPRSILARIQHSEEIAACDVNGNGRLDVVAGPWWLENVGDGSFEPHRVAADFSAARTSAADINGNGRPDVVLGEQALDFKKVPPTGRLVWFENPGEFDGRPWPMHVIDHVRCPHSVSVADLDGDGEVEIICGEHDPRKALRSRSRLFIYKKADPQGKTWFRHCLDRIFEHHDGTKIIELGDGHRGIISIGWAERRYVHLWEPY